MIPKYDSRGNLPPGVHQASWKEIQDRYGYNNERQQLLTGLKAALDNLKMAGCKKAYLNGSFITNKEVPGDYDLCWEPKGVDDSLIDPLFILTRYVLPPRKEQKDKYLGEIMITLSNPAVFDMLNYFQLDDRTGDVKGIISIELDELS
ncbi:hypothetical protein GC174_17240 [bacterium]|nr:hypothetical protein [bacterium]